jgi:hypothetical protein
MSLESAIQSYYPRVKRLMRRLDESDFAASELEIHANRLPRALLADDYWRTQVLSDCGPEFIIVLTAQTQPNEFTAFAFQSGCAKHLLGYVEEQYPESLDELVFFLGDNTERAIGDLLTKHGAEGVVKEVRDTPVAAREAAAEAAKLAGYHAVVGIRPEIVNEAVALIARAGAHQFFSADFDDRSAMLPSLCEKAGLKLTPNEEYYVVSL